MSRTFFRKFLPAVPRAAGRRRSPGFGPSRRRVRYYTLPRRGAGGKPSRTQDADNSIAVERRGTEGIPGGRAPRSGVSPRPIDIIAPGAQRFGSVRMLGRPAVPALAPARRRDRPGGAALARHGPPGRPAWPPPFGRPPDRRAGPHGSRLRGHPRKRRTGASGVRPPSARAAPQRPSLVDSLYIYI